MGAICRTPPSKLLHSGAGLLLTSCFRGGLVGVLQGQGCLPGPRPRSDSDLGLAPVAKRLRPSEECDALAAEAEEYVGGDEVIQCDALAAEAEEYVGGDEVIKGDSQKADDAAVPDHLWLRAFALGYGAAGHSARHLRALGCSEGAMGFLEDPAPPRGWRGALPGLRLFALRYWRSRVTRGYVAWHRANVPLPAGKQLVQNQWESKDGGARPVYEWVATGRRRYQCEWKVARASTEGRATVEAGFDAIHRCANAT